jgi:hypothetical protein
MSTPPNHPGYPPATPPPPMLILPSREELLDRLFAEAGAPGPSPLAPDPQITRTTPTPQGLDLVDRVILAALGAVLGGLYGLLRYGSWWIVGHRPSLPVFGYIAGGVILGAYLGGSRLMRGSMARSENEAQAGDNTEA